MNKQTFFRFVYNLCDTDFLVKFALYVLNKSGWNYYMAKTDLNGEVKYQCNLRMDSKIINHTQFLIAIKEKQTTKVEG